MSLPDGVTTCLLTYGPITDTFGNLADSITAEVVADRTIVHAATGRTMFDVPVSATADMGGVVQIAVPHTNQAGFRDKQQNSLTGWYYTITLTARFANGPKSDRKVFQPVTGQTTVDLDLISSDGMVTPGVTAPTAAVTSVNGQTGEVVVDAGAPTAPPGGFLVYATDDEAVADAYPQYAWLILADETPPVDPTTVVDDSFERTPNWGINTDGLGTAPTGQTWIKILGDWAVDTGGVARHMSGNFALTVIESGGADVTISATAAPGTVAEGRYVFCIRDDGTDVKHLIGRDLNGTWKSYNYNLATDAETNVVSGGAGSLTAGDVMSVTVTGTTAVLKKNGVTVLTQPNVVPTGTRHGLLGHISGNSSAWSDFKVTAP